MPYAQFAGVWPHLQRSDGLARAQMGTRRAAPVPLALYAEGLTETNAVRHLLINARSILIRPPSYLDLPPVVYGVAEELTETPIGARFVGAERHTTWRGVLTQTRGPGRDIVRGAWTYGDIAALGLTYRDLFTAYGLPSGSFGSYRDLLRAP